MNKTLWMAAVSSALALSACGGGGGVDGAVGGSAIFLKDAPIPTGDGRMADQVNIEILKVEVERGEDDITVFEATPGNGIFLNLLELTFPTLLVQASLPVGSYDEIEIKINPANATIHFADSTTPEPLIVGEEGDDEGELEFEFEPPFTVEADGTSNAVVDFAPLVTFNGVNYVLGHDHENDDTGEVEDVEGDDDHGAEVEGAFVSRTADVLTVSVNGATAQIDISNVTVFEVNDVVTDKDGFLASLDTGEEIEGEGIFADGMLIADKVDNHGVDD